MSLRAMRPSGVSGKMSTPSHSSLRPSSGCTARAVHSLTAKSSPQRRDRRSNRSVGQRAKIAAMWVRTAAAPATRSPAVWLWKTIASSCMEAIASRSCAFQAAS